MKSCDLIENMKGMEHNIINIEYDEIYWELIANKMKVFIKFFEKFIKDDKLKKMVLTGDKNITEQYIRSELGLL